MRIKNKLVTILLPLLMLPSLKEDKTLFKVLTKKGVVVGYKKIKLKLNYPKIDYNKSTKKIKVDTKLLLIIQFWLL